MSPTADDKVLLLTNHRDFSCFASYGGPANSRMYITVRDGSETVYIGLSGEYDDYGDPYLTGFESRYEFRIRKFTGTGNDPVVHGPFVINYANANVRNWDQAAYGQYATTLRLPNPAKGGAEDFVFQFTPQDSGNYYVEFRDIAGDDDPKVLLGFWDFTVVRNGAPQTGRVWSRNWAFRTPPLNRDNPDPIECGWDRPFNGTLFSYTTDGFVSKIDFKDSGFQGLAFTVAFTATGPGDPNNPETARQSIPGRNATLNTPCSLNGCSVDANCDNNTLGYLESSVHRIFLHEPDAVLFPSPESLCGAASPGGAFRCVGQDSFCLDVTVTRPGQVEIILDFNKNGQFDPEAGEVNIVNVIPKFAGTDTTVCFGWNGRKANGDPVDFGNSIDIITSYTQGIQHWSVYDGEFLKNGFCVKAVRPLCNGNRVGCDKLYWDDSLIAAYEESIGGFPTPGTGQEIVNLMGCECKTDNCRTWSNFDPNQECRLGRLNDDITRGYGDKNTLNTWWYANLELRTSANVPILTYRITGRDSICPGDSTEFIAEASSPGATFLWKDPDGNPIANPANPASTGVISRPGPYALTITDTSNCTRTDTVILTIIAPPQLQLDSLRNVTCEDTNDGAIFVSASGPAPVYTFTLNGGMANTTGVFTGLAPGAYTIIASDGGRCGDTLRVNVGVGETPAINYPEFVTACPNDTVRLRPLTTPADGLFFQWSPADGLDDPTSAAPLFQGSATTQYVVTISATPDGQCPFRDTVLVEVQQRNLTISGEVLVCDGTAGLSAGADGPVKEFIWLNAAGDTLATGAEATFPVSGDTFVRLLATTEEGCVFERDTLIRDRSIDVSVPQVVSACFGEDIIVGIRNNKPQDSLTYQWSPASLIDPNDAGKDSVRVIAGVGEYQLVVSIDNGTECKRTDTIRVVIYDPEGGLDFTAEPQCDGATVQFNATGPNAFAVRWDFGDPTTDADTSLSSAPTYRYSEAGTYTVTLTLQYDVSCADTVVKTVTVSEALLSADFSVALAECEEGSATLAFTDLSQNEFGENLEWSWVFSDGQTSEEQNPVITTMADELTVTFTIAAPLPGGNDTCRTSKTLTLQVPIVRLNLRDTVICDSASVVLNPGGDPGLEYTWSPAGGLSDPTAASPVASPAFSTVYTVTARAFGFDTCSVTREVRVDIAQVELAVSAAQDSCGVATLAAESNVPADSIKWYNSAGALVGTGNTVTVTLSGEQETFTAVATNAAGCRKEGSVTVINRKPQVALIQPEGDVNGCGPQEVAVQIENRNPGDTLRFAWSPADLVSDSTIANPTVRVESGTVAFTVRVRNQFECTDSLSFSVTAFEFPTIPDTTIFVCAGVDQNLTPDADSSYSYQWIPATGLKEGDDTSSNPRFIGTADTTVYQVVIKGMAGDTMCEVTRQVTVIREEPINLRAENDTTICSPGFVMLQASSSRDSIKFVWYEGQPAPENEIGTGEKISVQVDQTTVFFVLAMDPKGCTELTTDTVRVVEYPSLPSSLVICRDTALSLEDGYEYEWQPADGLDLSDPLRPVILATEDRTYTLVITEPMTMCSDTVELAVQVIPVEDIQLDVQLGKDLVCAGDTVRATASTNIPAAIEWYDNAALSGEPLATGSTFERVLPVGDYTLYVLAYGGECTHPDTVQVKVSVRSEEKIQAGVSVEGVGEGEAVCAADTVRLRATANLPATFCWYDNAQLTGEPIDTGAVLSRLLPAGDYTFYVLAKGGDCTIPDTAEITFSVREGSKIEITLATADTTICALDTLQLKANTNIPAAVSWYDNPDLAGDPIDGGMIFNVPLPVGVHTLYVLAEGGACTIPDTAQVRVTVLAPDTLEVTVAPQDTTVCEGETVVLRAISEQAEEFIWYADAALTIELGRGPTLPFVGPVGTSTIYVQARGGRCTLPGTARVNVFVNPRPPQLPIDTLRGCAGDTVRVDEPFPGQYQYSWNTTEGIDLTDPLRPGFSVGPAPTSYVLTITDPENGCETTQTIVVTPYAPLDLTATFTRVNLCNVNLEASTSRPAQVIRWYDNPDTTGAPIGEGNQLPIVVTADTMTYYVVAISPEGCVEVDSVVVTRFGNTTLPICEGDSLTLELDLRYNYQWLPIDEGIDAGNPARPVFAGTVDREYVVIISDPNVPGCVDTNRVQIRVSSLNLTLAPGGLLCEEEVTLTAATSRPALIEWFADAQKDSLLFTGPAYTVRPPIGTTVYYVTATDSSALGCMAMDAIVIDRFPVRAQIPPVAVCEGDAEAALTVVNLDPERPLTYMWFADNAGAILSDPTGATVQVNPTIGTTFSVDLMNEAGCTATLTTTVSITELPDSILAVPSSIERGESSQLSVVGCVGCTYEWLPGGQTTATITVTPEETTTYSVVVRRGDCVDTLMVTVTVLEPFECGFPYIFLPNAFSPNGDKVNDVLCVRGPEDRITSVLFIIYNRWGQEIFRSTSLNNCWDGTYQGQQLPPDVYGYYLEVVCDDGETYRTKGNVTLFR